jgi:hypothetical protein
MVMVVMEDESGVNALYYWCSVSLLEPVLARIIEVGGRRSDARRTPRKKTPLAAYYDLSLEYDAP